MLNNLLNLLDKITIPINIILALVSIITTFISIILILINLYIFKKNRQPNIISYIEKQNINGEKNNSKYFLVFENNSNISSEYTNINISKEWLMKIKESFNIKDSNIDIKLVNHRMRRNFEYSLLLKLPNKEATIKRNSNISYYLATGPIKTIDKLYLNDFKCSIISYSSNKKCKKKVYKKKYNKLTINEIDLYL